MIWQGFAFLCVGAASLAFGAAVGSNSATHNWEIPIKTVQQLAECRSDLEGLLALDRQLNLIRLSRLEEDTARAKLARSELAIAIESVEQLVAAQ